MPQAARRFTNSITALLLIPALAAIIALYSLPNLRLLASRQTATAKAQISQSLARFSAFSNTTMPRAPVIALSHGGGPMPLLNDANHRDMISSMRTRVPRILRLDTPDAPRAIVLVTAHWSQADPTVSSAPRHPLLYDYYGFPAETYDLAYDAPGSPEVAELVEAAFKAEGLKPGKDAVRGWDHGVFVPMLLVNPAANVPVVQVSVLEDESPERHFAMGRALAGLRDQNIAIVGSGFASLHNLRIMFDGTISTPPFLAKNGQYSKEIAEALAEEDVAVREKRMGGWRAFTGSYEMHPRDHADHFMPLLVCASAGGEGKVKSYADDFMGLKVWSYYWE